MMQWWSCKHGAPFDTKWRTIARRTNGRPGDVWAVASALFDCASQAEPRGDITNVDLEQIADGLGYELDFVQRVFSEMKDKGVHDGQLVLNFEKHQPKGDSTAAERKRRQREKEALASGLVTAGLVTDGHTHDRDSHGASRVTASDSVTVTDSHGDVTVENGGAERDRHGVTARHALDKTREEETRPEENRLEGESDSAARAREVVVPGQFKANDGSVWKSGWKPGDAVPDLWKVMARESRRQANMPPCAIDAEAAKFTRYYAARPNVGLRWFDAWISFVLKASAAPDVGAPAQPVARPAVVLWDHPAAAMLRAEMGGEFDTWLAPCRLEISDGVAMLHAPRKLTRDWIALHFMPRLESAFAPLMVAVSLDQAEAPNVAPLGDALDLPTCLARKVEAA